jgi:hypothetical protein
MLKNYTKYEFCFYRQSSIRTPSEDNLPIPIKINQENLEFKALYLSRWSKISFKIEISIEFLYLEETKISPLNLGNKRSSNFYSIPFKNVCTCTDLKLNENSKSTSDH